LHKWETALAAMWYFVFITTNRTILHCPYSHDFALWLTLLTPGSDSPLGGTVNNQWFENGPLGVQRPKLGHSHLLKQQYGYVNETFTSNEQFSPAPPETSDGDLSQSLAHQYLEPFQAMGEHTNLSVNVVETGLLGARHWPIYVRRWDKQLPGHRIRRFPQ
jgi:hypothetical protein